MPLESKLFNLKSLEKTSNLIQEVKTLLQQAREQTVRQVNQTMVITYYEIGRKIVEEEQKGNDRADYGKSIIKELSLELTQEFGKGFSETNLKQMRTFFLIYQKGQTVSDVSQFQLSWSHYLKLMPSYYFELKLPRNIHGRYTKFRK